MTVGSAVIDCLMDNGIDTIFGIPGKQTLPMNEAINERSGIRFVMARHETAIPHQAWGYAESSGRMAATVVIPGPGDLNASNGLKNALNDCTPMLHIAVETEPEVRGGDGIHETPPDTYDNIVKENFLVHSAESTVAVVKRAIDIARSPPMGPVRVGIPKNFLPRTVPQAVPTEMHVTFDNPRLTVVRDVVDLLATAERPLLIAGGGVRNAGASEILRSMAERLDAPVATTYKGKATFPEDHPLFTGVISGGTSTELADVIDRSDAVMAIGSDLDAVWTKKWSYDFDGEGTDLIQITLDPSDIGIGTEPTIAIVADARSMLEMVSEELEEVDGIGGGGEDRAKIVRESDHARLAELRDGDEPPITSVSALHAVREAVPRDTIITADAGGSRLWTLVSFPVYRARDYVNPGSWASMGTGLPSAIGAKLANPDRMVVSLAGEGGLLMAIHELHTLAAEDLDVTCVVLNNNDYAIISEEAERSYRMTGGEYGWTETAPLSITEIAKGMGVRAEFVETPDEIIQAVIEGMEYTGPAVIEVRTDPYEPQASVWMTR